VGKVIVLGASYGALAVVRALAKEGIPVILMFSDPHDHACHSRFTSQRVRIPNPMDDSEGLLALLMETKEDWDGALLIPTLDEYVIFVSQNRTELQKRYVFTVRDWDVPENH
jgi:predicted ATP-grasp superfamily ATP-dependent carboligase